MVLFDTLRASRQLQEAGFEAPKADAIVTAFAEDVGERVATKVDLAALRSDLERTEERLRAEIAAVRGDLAQTEERLRGEIAQTEHRVVNRMYLTMGGLGGFLTAVIALATTVIVALG